MEIVRPIREQRPGLFLPIIDRNRCEGKGAVCTGLPALCAGDGAPFQGRTSRIDIEREDQGGSLTAGERPLSPKGVPAQHAACAWKVAPSRR